jgi:hypothetical protein
MDYHGRVDDLGSWFVEHPLDLNMEADMQCRLIDNLHKAFQKSESLMAACPDPPLNTKGNFAKYKMPYIDQIEKKRSAEEVEISRVHPEINLSDNPDPNEQIDVVVFDEELDHSVDWNGGSKRYDERDVAAAFELKFIKNQNVITGNFDSKYLSRASEQDMRSEDAIARLDKQNRKLQSDLSRLNALPTVDTFLIIFSHYNYLFQPPLLDAPGSTRKKNRKMGWTVDAWFSEVASNNSTDILYAHPGGVKWW